MDSHHSSQCIDRNTHNRICPGRAYLEIEEEEEFGCYIFFRITASHPSVLLFSEDRWYYRYNHYIYIAKLVYSILQLLHSLLIMKIRDTTLGITLYPHSSPHCRHGRLMPFFLNAVVLNAN